jgi:hypothetical protein
MVRELLVLEYELREFRKLVEQPVDIDHRDNPAVSRWPTQLRLLETAIERVTQDSKDLLNEFKSATYHRSFWNYKRHSNDLHQAIKHTFDSNFLQPEESAPNVVDYTSAQETNTENKKPNEGIN